MHVQMALETLSSIIAEANSQAHSIKISSASKQGLAACLLTDAVLFVQAVLEPGQALSDYSDYYRLPAEQPHSPR